MKRQISRRKFMAGIAVTALGGACFPTIAWAKTSEKSKSTIYVVHGSDPGLMLKTGIAKMGGWEKFVKPGKKAVLKPNAAWSSLPEQGGNTTPELVEACVRECLRAGASEVIVPEKSCSPFKTAFDRSGIEAAVKRSGGRMYSPEKKHFQRVEIPKGVNLKEAEIVKDVLDAPFLINMPVAKSHGGATLTLSMKNWMGSVSDRGYWHRSNLHQCIADLSSFIKPDLIVIDAIRIMTTGGPQGPGDLEYPKQLIFGTDPVAMDAYAATLFGKKPFDVLHIKLAHEMQIGCGQLDLVRVEHINA